MSRADAMLRLERARWWSLSEAPFYGALAMRLADVIDPNVKTACTDGKVIKWNPDFVMKLSDERLRFVLIHETMHCAHQHLWRLPADDIGNQAGDHAINLTLKAVRGMEMPPEGLADPRFDGKCEEDIYTILQAEQPPGGGSGNDPNGGGGGSGNASDASDGDGEGQGTGDPCGGFSAPDAGEAPNAAAQAQAKQELAEQWESAVMQAAQTAQALGRGDLPADLQRELERRRATQIDWKRELADFIRDSGATKADWSRSARRHAWQPVIYPRRRPQDYGVIICARDTSGSIGDAICAQFTALIEQCAAETTARIIMIDCDADIQAEHVIEIGEPVPLKAAGGGGTDFRPVFARADELTEQGEHVAGIVYLTDLAGSFPVGSDHPTLWLSTDEGAAPFGRTVRIDEGRAL